MILHEDSTPLHAAFRHLNWRLPEFFVKRLNYIQIHRNPLIPIDIDTHHIASSPEDGETSHTHFDMRYLFLGDERILSKDDEMVRKHNPKWFELDYLYSIKSFEYIPQKINDSFSAKYTRKRFYSEITQSIYHKNISLIIVAHIIPDIIDYIMSLDNIFNLLCIIAKPKSINNLILEKLTEEKISVKKIEKNSKEFEEFITNQIEISKSKVVLIDIGGWFAPIIENLYKRFPEKIIGVVEDTENGHQKYETLTNINFPVLSVARSPLKDFEDFLIGKSIVYSADNILRQQSKVLEYLNCAVIGYGKIGKSIAQNIAKQGIQPSVYDKKHLRRLEAYNRFFKIPSWSEILQKSDVIFSATGGQAMSLVDYKMLKNGAYIFSVTSSDDEFNFSFLKNEYKIEIINQYIEKYVGPTN